MYVQVCRKVWSNAQLSRPNTGGGGGGGVPVVSPIFLKLPVPSFSELSSPDIWRVVPPSLGFCVSSGVLEFPLLATQPLLRGPSIPFILFLPRFLIHTPLSAPRLSFLPPTLADPQERPRVPEHFLPA